VIVYSSKQIRDDFNIQSITKQEQIQEIINEFEPNINLKRKSRLSLDGFRNMMLSEQFSLVKPWCIQRPYQDMTRSDKSTFKYFRNKSFLDR